MMNDGTQEGSDEYYEHLLNFGYFDFPDPNELTQAEEYFIDGYAEDW